MKMRIPGQATHRFRRESIHQFRREALQFLELAGIGDEMSEFFV